VPPLAGSEVVLTLPEEKIAMLELKGLKGPIRVRQQLYDNEMPAFEEVLSDDELSMVLSYVRTSWGNSATPVTATTVKKVREDLRKRLESFTAKELGIEP